MNGKHSFSDLMAMREYCMQNLPPYSADTSHIEILARVNVAIEEALLKAFPKEEEE